MILDCKHVLTSVYLGSSSVFCVICHRLSHFHVGLAVIFLIFVLMFVVLSLLNSLFFAVVVLN